MLFRSNFSADLMEAAKSGLERIITAAENIRHLQKSAPDLELTEREDALLKEAEIYTEKFEAAMEDDFNTADAVSAVFELVKFSNTNTSADHSKGYLEKLYRQLLTLCDTLGIIIEKEEEMLEDEIEELIAKRQAARKEKDFAKADEIRSLLLEKGIQLKDTREGVQWKRV